MHRTAVVILALLAPWCTAVPAQSGIRIVKVPEQLQLPAKSGSNLLLEVELTEQPEAVWLATDATAQDRVPLQKVGALRYQQNLADARLTDLLPAGRDQGSLFVFAQIGKQKVTSAAITWSRQVADDGKLRCLVRRQGKPTLAVEPEQPAWLDPEQLERIELQRVGARQSTAVARLPDVDLPLVRRAAEKLWVLEGDATVRERLRAVRTFEIEVHLGTASALFAFRCVPPRLDLQEPVTTFIVQQRKQAFVPGSRDWLQVRLDDITMGHVLLDIVTADGAVVLAQQFVHERDHVEFALANGRYVLAVQKLVNLLIGDDHAELTVQAAEGFHPDRIGQLLRAVAGSGDTFLREGKEYPGPAAAQFLIAKLGSHRGTPPTLAEFVDTFASQSSKTGEVYQVRQKDERVVTMRDWLRQALANVEAAEAKGARGK